MDASNLSEGRRARDFRHQVELYRTADVVSALGFLGNQRGRRALDLGGGNGLGAVLLLELDARPLIIDLSLPRLLEARRQLAALGLADRVDLVLASADRLPLATGSIDALFTKSTLIHVPLHETIAECARVLSSRGRVALIEPQRRNPFVNLYRRVAAPAVWREITTYFGPAEWSVVRAGLGGGRSRFESWFFLGFLASALIFLVPSARAYRWAESLLVTIDRLLFHLVPGLRKRAWFGIYLHRQ